MVLRLRSLKGLGKHVRVASGSLRELKRAPIARRPSVPQMMLWKLVKEQYPEAEEEKRGLVPGRRYVVDMVIERLGLVIELDGWESHGKYKSGFKRDREKDRALLLAGYRVVRFYASEVTKDPGSVMATLEQVVEMLESEGSSNHETTRHKR